MDNITHTIVGVAMSEAGLNRFAKRAYPIWLLMLGANGPDIDVFGALGGGAGYLEIHRGPTHSFFGAPVISAIATGMVWMAHRKWRKDEQFPWIPSFLLALAGVLSHLLCDYVTPYGTRLLWPFSNVRFSWDICPILDLWVLPVIMVAILSPFFFRLISDEIGASKTSFRPAAVFVLLCIVLMCGTRAVAHRRVMSMLDSFIYKGREPKRFSAYPDSGSPFLWHAVVDTGETLEEVDVHVFEPFDPTETRSFYPPDPNPAIDIARQTRTGKAFLDFAVYPYTYMDRYENGYEVVFRDLRYEYGTLKIRKGAVARIRLDQNLKVVSERFSFRDQGMVR